MVEEEEDILELLELEEVGPKEDEVEFMRLERLLVVGELDTIKVLCSEENVDGETDEEIRELEEDWSDETLDVRDSEINELDVEDEPLVPSPSVEFVADVISSWDTTVDANENKIDTNMNPRIFIM